MTTIRNTITNAVGDRIPREYQGYVDRVIAALTAREVVITEQLADYAASKGLSSAEINDLFVEVGLLEPTPEPTPTPASGSDSVSERLASIERVLDQVVNVASNRLGITITR